MLLQNTARHLRGKKRVRVDDVKIFEGIPCKRLRKPTCFSG